MGLLDSSKQGSLYEAFLKGLFEESSVCVRVLVLLKVVMPSSLVFLVAEEELDRLRGMLLERLKVEM